MAAEDFYKAPLLDQILYDETGMLVENHPSIAEAMEKYHQAKLKLLSVGDVVGQSEQLVCDTMNYSGCKYWINQKEGCHGCTKIWEQH
jgi:DNA-binding transcriptional regulator LsrR (DeoR family)